MKRAAILVVPLLGLVFACAARQTTAAKEPAPKAASGEQGKELGIASGGGTTSEPAPSSTSTNGEPDWGIMSPGNAQEYARVVAKVAAMNGDSDLQSRVSRRNLSLVNVMWEDTGRAQGSALGPNISDLTLQVRRKDENGQFQSALMPVIRPPNFVDRTGDVPADRFFVRVGNERDGSLRSVPLTDVLKNLKAFSSRPESILGEGNLLAARDSHFLVSAQAVFLPIPKSGKAEFNPVLFNYQSAPGSPAVLTILVTRQGSSIQVIENKGDDRTAFGSGQQLYFNDKGQRSAFTAERKTDVEQRIAAQGGPKTEDDKSALQKGADVLFLVQVPLKHHNLGRIGGPIPPPMQKAPMGGAAKGMAKPSAAPAPMMDEGASAEKSDVEQAVLGHGPHLGPFNEGHSLKFERDPKFPIRITVQFYKATSNGVVSDIDLDSISKSIGSVYEHAEFVGSLVLPDGDPRRPTAWQKVPHEWFPW